MTAVCAAPPTFWCESAAAADALYDARPPSPVEVTLPVSGENSPASSPMPLRRRGLGGSGGGSGRPKKEVRYIEALPSGEIVMRKQSPEARERKREARARAKAAGPLSSNPIVDRQLRADPVARMEGDSYLDLVDFVVPDGEVIEEAGEEGIRKLDAESELEMIRALKADPFLRKIQESLSPHARKMRKKENESILGKFNGTQEAEPAQAAPAAAAASSSNAFRQPAFGGEADAACSSSSSSARSGKKRSSSAAAAASGAHYSNSHSGERAAQRQHEHNRSSSKLSYSPTTLGSDQKCFNVVC